MTVNSFFLLLMAGLIGIYIFFSPMNIKETEPKEVSMLDLKQFTMYKIDQIGLQSVMVGSKGQRFTNRYEVYDINLTDDSREHLQNMKADFARYQGEKVLLEGNVRYKSADGMMFLSDEAQYYHRKAVATTQGPFTVVEKSDWLIGRKLYYDSIKGVARGENIKGIYTLMETKEN
jgi:hypothetical protein